MDLLIFLFAICTVLVIYALSKILRKGAIKRKPSLILLAVSVVVAVVSVISYNSFSFETQDNALLEEFTDKAVYSDYKFSFSGYTPCEGGINSIGINEPFLYYSFTKHTSETVDMSSADFKSSDGFFASPGDMGSAESLVIFKYRPDKNRTYDVYINGVKKGNETFYSEAVDVWLFNLKTKEYVFIEYFAASPAPAKGSDTKLNHQKVMKSVEKLIG